ncbi:hypothetical protein SAMN05216311_12347 [Chitinophaga sp. CF418]|nr:hypothetical protein SAMN05216311_12347 [Chitinophaga sp. CF418]
MLIYHSNFKVGIFLREKKVTIRNGNWIQTGGVILKRAKWKRVGLE